MRISTLQSLFNQRSVHVQDMHVHQSVTHMRMENQHHHPHRELVACIMYKSRILSLSNCFTNADSSDDDQFFECQSSVEEKGKFISSRTVTFFCHNKTS